MPLLNDAGHSQVEESMNRMVDWLGPIIGIVLVDLILSGDNAVVIGAAAAAFPAVIAEPMPCKLAAAAVNTSGCVVTNDMCSS